MLEGIKKAAFIGCHSDDEFICAGTLHRLAKQGCEVHVLTFAPAATSEDRTGTNVSIETVKPEWESSLDLIGVGRGHRKFYGLTPSADLHPYRQRICQEIYDFCEKEKPNAVFVLSPDDENTAHAIVGIESERVMRGRVPMTIRCQFPWNFSVGRPNLYVSLSQEDLTVKRAVIDAYASQKFRYQYSDILMHYAIAQGLSVKVPAAETFEIIRAVV